MHYIDLGGGMKLRYWKDDNDLWHIKSDVTEEEHVSYEEFDEKLFFSGRFKK